MGTMWSSYSKWKVLLIATPVRTTLDPCKYPTSKSLLVTSPLYLSRITYFSSLGVLEGRQTFLKLNTFESDQQLSKVVCLTAALGKDVLKKSPVAVKQMPLPLPQGRGWLAEVVWVELKGSWKGSYKHWHPMATRHSYSLVFSCKSNSSYPVTWLPSKWRQVS